MSRRSFYTSLLCIVLCLLTLLDSDSMFAPYLLVSLFAIFCLFKNQISDIDKKSRAHRIIMIVSFIAAIFITLANHGIWLHPVMPDIRSALFVRICKLLYIIIILSGVYVSVYNILVFIRHDPQKMMFKSSSPDGRRPILFFLIPFVGISVLYLTIYFCCYYPGLLSLDSIDQVDQIFTGVYSNHQPFYHTLLISLFIRTGLAVSGNINAAVCAYAIFQVVFMAAVFSFVIYNMALLRLPTSAAVITGIWYALMPFHIMFSFTVWKDVLFGAFVTCLITFFIRLMTDIGNRSLNYIGFAISGPFICLLRSNGLFAYLFVFLAMILLSRKQKKILYIMLTTILVCLFLKHGLLKICGVTAPDTVESLSIPLQQISRVIVEDGYIEEADRELFSQIIDIDSVKDEYDPEISDPIKNMIRDFGNQEYLSQNIGAFGAAYLKTFVHNPMTYVIAWTDSTRGYWNSGYDYWIWYWDVESNGFGITRSVASPRVLQIMDEYLWLYYNNTIFRVFTAIGLHVWILLMLLSVNIFTGNRTGIIAAIPILAILLSLLISSPVFSEFRYMYALFCSLPIITAITLSKSCQYNREGSNEDNM
ncbi:MAG: hypothetical protein J5367_07085 [Lachnospiraceae bacterium]|nr:hypothetical protein [Lachnospiraceae bacterium]